MKSIYLDSTQIHSNDTNIGMVVSPNIIGLDIATIRLPSYDRPNIDGAIVPNQLYGGRAISLTGKVFGGSVSDYRTSRQTLEKAVAIKRSVDGVLSPMTFKFTTMDDLALQISVYTRQFQMPDEFLTHANFKLDMFSPDTYIVSQNETVAQIYTFQGGGMAIPMAIPIPMITGGSTVSNLANNGNIKAFPTITLQGPLTNPVLSNLTTGETMTFAYTLTHDYEQIVIDTLNRTVIYIASLGANPVNIRQYMTGDFVTIYPGNNEVKLTVGSYNPSGLATLQYRDSYSGI
jgi:hypothetical protein